MLPIVSPAPNEALVRVIKDDRAGEASTSADLHDLSKIHRQCGLSVSIVSPAAQPFVRDRADMVRAGGEMGNFAEVPRHFSLMKTIEPPALHLLIPVRAVEISACVKFCMSEGRSEQSEKQKERHGVHGSLAQ